MAEIDGSGQRTMPLLSVVGNWGLLMFGVAALIFASSNAGLIPRRTETTIQPIGYNVDVHESRTPVPDFHLVQLGTFRRDQFLVDNRTGRVWTSICMGKTSGADCSGSLMWEEMYVDGITPEDSLATFMYHRYLQTDEGEGNKPKSK
jgi:hypothetical protein